ncbi:MAG: di-trans,poly-cis-decaprenylcistransferase [Kiritimatiellae bacterium]|nr:di-trans,poly-cis-decaprenylcistransferase [Kiritimatiellia bacterium]
MDGNGRWAKARRKPRISGHKEGALALDRVMHYCREEGIEYLTVYAFSTENWNRSRAEVTALMNLLSSYIKEKSDTLLKNQVRFKVIGRRSDLSKSLQKSISQLEEKTKDGQFTLIVALSYGGRDEILRAAEKYSGGGEEAFSKCLDTADIPDPDLIIRTSGELRLSNFLLWQAAYSEFYFTDVMWPDFGREEFDKALNSYKNRERRMGSRKGVRK